MPATVSTLPDMPFGSFGVSTGSAWSWPAVPDEYSAHFVPNSFWALPMETVAVTRRCVTSALTGLPFDLNGPSTALITEVLAPYFDASVDSDRYLPYELDDGLLAASAAFWMPDWLAISPIWRVSFV